MKTKNWVLFLTIFLIAIVQATALEYISISGAKPDLLLISVAFLALFLTREDAIKAAIFAGLFKDITSTALLGSNAAGLFLCVLFLARFGNHFYKQRPYAQVLLCAAVYFVTSFVVLLINAIKNPHINLALYIWLIFKAAVYTGCVSPLVFFILSRIFGNDLYSEKYI